MSSIERQRAVPEAAEVVVIGGGVIGTSIAYHFALHGADVLLLERGELASGASGRNAGMVYTGEGGHEPALGIIPLTMRSRWRLQELARQWRAERIGFTPCVTLDLFFEEDEKAQGTTTVGWQQRAGKDACIIDGDAARSIVPGLADDVVAARYDPQDAKIVPYELVFAYGREASRLGATICTHTTVTGLRVCDGTLQAVETDRGTVRCERAIITTNAWAPEIGAMAGLEIPIRPFRGQIFVTQPAQPLFSQNLLTSGAYWRQMPDGQVVIGGGARHDPHLWTYRMDMSLIAIGVAARSAARATPAIERLRIVRSWAGTMGFTVDHNPIIGRLANPQGLSIAAGFSGSGNPYAVSAAELLVDLHGGPPSNLPAWAVSPERFGL